MELLGAALQKVGPESGAEGAKGLQVPGGTTRTHPGSQAEAAEQVFGQGDLWVLWGHRRSRDRLCGSTGAQSHLSVRSHVTLTKVLKLCKRVSLSVRWMA